MPADYRDKYHRDRTDKDRGERRRRGSSEERDQRRSPNDKYRSDRWHSRKSRSRSRTPPRVQSKSNKYIPIKDYPQGRGETKYEGFRTKDEYERRDQREGRNYDSDMKRRDYEQKKGYLKYRHQDKPAERREYSKDERKEDRRDYNKEERKEERKDPKKEEKKRWSSPSSFSKSYSPKQNRSKRDEHPKDSKQDIKKGGDKAFYFRQSNKERRELGKREESVKDGKQDTKAKTYQTEKEEKVRYVRNNEDKEQGRKEFNDPVARKTVTEDPAKIEKTEEKILLKSPEPKRVDLKREESKREESKRQDNLVMFKQGLPKIGMKYPPPPPPPPSAPQYKSFENKPQREYYKGYDKRDQDRESRRDYQKDFKRDYQRREPERENRKDSNPHDSKDIKKEQGDQFKWNKSNNQRSEISDKLTEKLKILREGEHLQPLRRGNDEIIERKATEVPIQKTKVSKFDLMINQAKNNLIVAPIPSSFLLLDTFKNMNKFYAEILEPRWASLLRLDLEKYEEYKQPIISAISNSIVTESLSTEQPQNKTIADSKLWLWVKEDRKEEEIDLKFRLQEMRQQGAMVSELVRRLRFLD